MKIIFWSAILIVFYVYVAYPIIIYLASLFYKKRVKIKYLYPTVSILMSVYNEEKNIENKIKSLLDLDYPIERLEVLIGSDGSTDSTEEIISKYSNKTLSLYRQPKRQGKPSILNMLVPNAKGEILVFTDARQRLDRNSLKELVRNFSDRKVGSASSALFYENGSGNKTGAGLGLYWKYEKFIRKSESRMGSMLGATGAMYAIRRELFPELPKDLILDDVYVPMKIVERGYRAIFDSKAKVYDKVFSNPKEEFLRKTRTLAGNFQLFIYLKQLFNPLKGKISWQFFSHKFLRLLVPFLLLIIFVTNIFILDNIIYWITFTLQVLLYTFAVLGALFKNTNRLLDVPYMFCVMNSAVVVGLYRFSIRKENSLWEKAGS